MERRVLITSIFITIGAIAFLSGYLLMPERGIRKQAGLITDRFSDKDEVGLSKDKIPNILPVSSRKFLTFVNPFSDSKKIVAVTANGEIVEVDTINLTEKVTYSSQTTITEAVLSPAGDSVIYSFYDTKNNKKWVYHNLKTGEPTEIEGNLNSTAFSPRGQQVAYLINKDNGGEPLIAKDGKVIKRALKTRLGAGVINWPSEDFISIISYDKSGYGDLFSLKDDGLNKILSYQYDLNVKWSPSGERMVFSAKNDTGYERLFYKDVKNNGSNIDMDVATNASKCIWTSEEEVICGLKNQAQLKDEFNKINITDGFKTLVATPNINLLVEELALSRSEDTLLVLNDIDEKLYALKLAANQQRVGY